MKSIMKEMVGGCCVCSDERGWPENPLVYCDGQGCTVAVHQACYGIVTVPTGPWYCRKCESQERSARVRCELCPSKDGALKRTDNSGWAHVVCALYIPEVRFGNVTTMEPIILQLIPTERFNKVCYICEELGKGSRSTVGACMQCNKSGCKQQFHVTCAQALGLLCEEAGNYLDNVKYCGYCQHHYSKLIGWPPVKKSINYYDHIKEHSHKHSSKKQKKGGNVKTIPPYKPIPADNHSSDSSPEKEVEAGALAASAKGSQPPHQPQPPPPPQQQQQQQSASSGSSSSSSKRKSGSSASKSGSSSSKSSSSASKSASGSTGGHQKTVHNSSSSSGSAKSASSSDKSSSSKGVSSSSSSSSSSGGAVKSAKGAPDAELTSAVNTHHHHHAEPDAKAQDKAPAKDHHHHHSSSSSSAGPKFTNSTYGSGGGGSSEPAPPAPSDPVYGGDAPQASAPAKDSTSGSSSSKSSSKKRKAGSRTPTPNSLGHSAAAVAAAVDSAVAPVDKPGSVSTIVSVGQSAGSAQNPGSSAGLGAGDRRDSVGSADSVDKPKKAKTEHIPPPPPPPPAAPPPPTAPAASHIPSSGTGARTTSSPSVIAGELQAATPVATPLSDATAHSTPTGHAVSTASGLHAGQTSLVVSVPLASTTLSPIASHPHQHQASHHHHSSQHHAPSHHHHHHHQQQPQQQHHHVPHPAQVNNSAHGTGAPPAQPQPPAPSHYQHHADRNDRAHAHSAAAAAANGPVDCISTSLDSTMVSSETSDGLKIAYEKQPTLNSSSLSRLGADTPASVAVDEAPAKRSRSQSADKSSEKMGRPKKRGSNGVTTVSGPATGAGKRTSRAQHPTPPPPAALVATAATSVVSVQPGAFSSVTQQVVKESPPSSPSDENNSVGSSRRNKGRKSAPATVTSVPSSSSSTASSGKPDTKETKDIKVFQNGVHAPHMLGNQLNPNSNMAQKMSDHLTSELEAHSIFNPAENSTSNLVGPQLHSRVIASVRSTTSTTSASNSSSGFSSMLGGGSGGAVPQTLDQLLERQWEQGSQFLMEQAQHFDIASLLSCLHQLRAENLRLEEHVNSLLQRRDHLLAVNARLAIPLTNQQPVAAPSQPHTMNNLHPSVTASHGDVPRSRHGAAAGYPAHPGASAPPLENGLPPDGAAYPHQHRSPANAQPQPSPTIRHSPAGSAYPSTSSHGVVRSGSASEGSGRSSQRSQGQAHASYPQYQGPVSAPQQPQMVIRREAEHHQMTTSKPS